MDKDKSEIEGARFILPPFVPLLFLSQKVLNNPSDLGEGTKSLNHVVCIPKIFYSRSANFALDFPGKEDSKGQKKILY